MLAAPPPLAFTYDRCVTSNPAMLDMRLQACAEHLAEQGWSDGGQFVDHGDDALTHDTRPAFDELLRAMVADSGRERVCLVYNWGRLSHDAVRRQEFTHSVLGAGGWLATITGEAVRIGAVPHGRLTLAPVIA
ncbi:recombinase family protein [Streptomyces sp. NPDC001165]|uniref:recombinase family protein n=1 Tax=Streptomyces sp. NPDC001165 TaxID=3364546 RepID=UPI00368ED36A